MPKTKVKDEEVVEEEVIEEPERILNWRRGFFQNVLGSGVSDLEIERLVVNAAVSPHDARRLLEQGCPRPLIVDILS